MKKELMKSAFKLIGHLIIVIGLLLILGLFIKELFQEVTMNIKELRNLTGLSQTAFGEKYDIPMRTIQNWEKGIRVPPTYVLKLLERAVKEDFNIMQNQQQKALIYPLPSIVLLYNLK